MRGYMHDEQMNQLPGRLVRTFLSDAELSREKLFSDVTTAVLDSEAEMSVNAIC